MDVIILIKGFFHIQIYISKSKQLNIFLLFYQTYKIYRSKACKVIGVDSFHESANLLPKESLQAFNELYWKWNSANFRWKHFTSYKSQHLLGKIRAVGRFTNGFIICWYVDFEAVSGPCPLLWKRYLV